MTLLWPFRLAIPAWPLGCQKNTLSHYNIVWCGKWCQCSLNMVNILTNFLGIKSNLNNECYNHIAVTSESLVSREFSRFFFKFHLSISVSRYFYFTFTSRKEWNKKSFHFSFLKKSERNICFTFHFSKKVRAFQISLLFSRKKSKIVHVTLNFVMKNSMKLVM